MFKSDAFSVSLSSILSSSSILRPAFESFLLKYRDKRTRTSAEDLGASAGFDRRLK